MRGRAARLRASSYARVRSRKASAVPPRSGCVSRARARNARFSSASVAVEGTPMICQMDGRGFEASSRDAGAPPARTSSASRAAPHGARPTKIFPHARAHRASISTRRIPAARSAAASASSCDRAPPSYASGFRNGSRDGAPVHHAAQRKRRRRVVVIAHAGAKSAVIPSRSSRGANTTTGSAGWRRRTSAATANRARG